MYNFMAVYPVDMNRHVVSQVFGVNKQAYEKFIVGGRPLQGHNGLDLAPYNGMPAPVTPADDGYVKKIGNDPLGWGNYIDIQHTWGYSRYAHLSKILCKYGETVNRPGATTGTVIGMTGDTGNVWSYPGHSAVHLHLGFYPTQEPLNNGFGGAIDPQPLLVAYASPGPAPIDPVPSEPLKEGVVIVTAPSGLKLRREHTQIPDTYYTVMPLGTRLNYTGETHKDYNGVVWGKVECWIGIQLADGTRLVENEENINRTFSLLGGR